MFHQSKKRINQLRRQPEDVRLRAATRLSLLVAVALAVISLTVLLPLQLYFGRPSSEPEIATPIQTPQVGGVFDDATSTASQ